MAHCTCAPHAGAKGCIKIITATTEWHDGHVTVYVDQGAGFKAATLNGKYYGEGATVLDECYANLKAVRMQNVDPDSWDGSVTFARDKAAPYAPGICTTCTRPGSTADIVFDGDGNGAASTACLDGKMCDITFALKEPTLTRSGMGFATSASKCQEYARSVGAAYHGRTPDTTCPSCAPLGCYRWSVNGQYYWNNNRKGACTTTRACIPHPTGQSHGQHSAPAHLGQCHGARRHTSILIHGRCVPPQASGVLAVGPAWTLQETPTGR